MCARQHNTSIQCLLKYSQANSIYYVKTLKTNPIVRDSGHARSVLQVFNVSVFLEYYEIFLKPKNRCLPFHLQERFFFTIHEKRLISSCTSYQNRTVARQYCSLAFHSVPLFLAGIVSLSRKKKPCESYHRKLRLYSANNR